MGTDVGELLSEAWKAVQAAKIPEPLQELALGRAIDLLAGDWEPPRRPAGKGKGKSKGGGKQGQHARDSDDSEEDESDEDALFQKMSTGTGVSAEQLERLLHVDDGAVRVFLKKGELPPKAAAAQKAIALLIIVGTHYLTGEEDVDLALVREECKELTVLDSNFGANINSIPNLKPAGRRGSNTKTVRVRKALIQSFGDELTKLGLLSRGQSD